MELTREHFRALIYYDFRRGLTQEQCIDQLHSTFGDEAPSTATVYRWYTVFKSGRSSLKDEVKEVVQNRSLCGKISMLCEI